MSTPNRPQVFHIVHIDKLASIIADGGLLSDASVVKLNRGGPIIGMADIKRRRLTELKLSCHPQVYVGQCVPFYFCPRSVMLFLIHRANHPDLEYREGQTPIVHLEFDLHEAIEWAESEGRRWAVTLSNAGARYTEHYCDLRCLDDLDWDAIRAADWRQPAVKEAKQAEFLIEESVPWHLVKRIGTISMPVARKVLATMSNIDDHRPVVEVKCEWYY